MIFRSPAVSEVRCGPRRGRPSARVPRALARLGRSVRTPLPGLVLGLLLAGNAGCPVSDNLPAPGRVIEERDPSLGRSYYLYVPTRYVETEPFGLVVTCHGTRPWDSARAQFDEWKGLAEQKSFLLVAPDLLSSRGDFTPSAEKQIALLYADEEAILSIIRTVRAARRVDPTRIFITGWSAGGYPTLFTGLRHPEIFRAVSVRQGNFDPAFLEPCIPFMDRYQPIQILYGANDVLLKDQSLAALEWLRSHDLKPTPLERPGIHRRDRDPVFRFFADVIRRRPWVRINVRDDADDPMKVQLRLQTSFEPDRYLWDFGDGGDFSPVSSPAHRYQRPGIYVVRAAVWAGGGDPLVRQVELNVPRVRLGVQSATMPAEGEAPQSLPPNTSSQ